MKITDDKTYFKRTGTGKKAIIESFISTKIDIHSMYDAGCNNGDISYYFQKKYMMDVLGVDFSDDLAIPEDYNFKHVDIVENDYVHFSDATLFLSLYHHIIAKYSLEVADDVFVRLLLRTKYMIFDTGNVSERSRRRMPWHVAQRAHFKSEDELLDHFGIEYEKIGEWGVGGGKRSIVVFKREDFIKKFRVVGTYNRKRKRVEQKWGLYPIGSSEPNLFPDIVFRKLEYNSRLYFSKKRKNISHEEGELDNIVAVYNGMDHDNLIRFYGYTEEYGIIFEWIDDFQYIKQESLVVGDRVLRDVDLISVDGKLKYIDFER